MNQWDIHGWGHLSGTNLEATKARQDILQRLRRIPEPDRTYLCKQLKGKSDHPHFSARLEIQLHDFFKRRGWDVRIEQNLQGKTPDFLLTHGEDELIVEAKTVLDPESMTSQEARLHKLADGLTGRLRCVVSLHPRKEIPPSLPYKKVAAEIEHRATNTQEELLEFRITGEHNGYSYDIEVTILHEEKSSESTDVGSTMTLFHPINTGNRIRNEIIKKAKKYAFLQKPFIVAVWPKTSLYNANLTDEFNDDSIALAGDEVWRTDWIREWRDGRNRNGVFSLQKEDGRPRYSCVSAVIIYNFTYTYGDGPTHTLRVYHNPFADFPLGSHVFQGVPQARINRVTGLLKWETESTALDGLLTEIPQDDHDFQRMSLPARPASD